MAFNSVTPADSEFRYEWTVTSKKFYASRTPVGAFLKSPIFSSGPKHDDLSWQMKIYPRGIDDCNHDNVSLSVRLIQSRNDAQVRAKLICSIFNRGHLFTREIATSTFVPGTSADTLRFNNFVRRSSLDPISEDSPYPTFRIVCEIEDIKMSYGETDAVPFAIPACSVLRNLRSFYESKKFTDVKLTISGQAFQAHKLVLAMHSPVFSAMFEHETVEKNRNEVEITDVTPAAFDEMLRFMYTGEVKDIEMIEVCLLIAAEKYAIERLKVMCEEALYKNVVVENAADMLILADTHNADQLKPRVLKFIASRAKDVMATLGFQSMIQSHPHLVAETLQTVVEMQN